MKYLMIKRTVILLVILISHNSLAQGTALEIGYYNSRFNALKIGASYRITYKKDPAINIGMALHTNFKNKHQLYINSQIRIQDFLDVGVNLSTKEIEPTIGLNFLNWCRINTGYSINYDDHNLNHITFGLSVFLGVEEYYDYLQVMF